MHEEPWITKEARLVDAGLNKHSVLIRTTGDGDIALDICVDHCPIGDDRLGGSEIEFCTSGIRNACGCYRTIAALRYLIAAIHDTNAHPELPLWGAAQAKILDDMHGEARHLLVEMDEESVLLVITQDGKVLESSEGRAYVRFVGLPSHVMGAFREVVIAMQLDGRGAR